MLNSNYQEFLDNYLEVKVSYKFKPPYHEGDQPMIGYAPQVLIHGEHGLWENLNLNVKAMPDLMVLPLFIPRKTGRPQKRDLIE